MPVSINFSAEPTGGLNADRLTTTKGTRPWQPSKMSRNWSYGPLALAILAALSGALAWPQGRLPPYPPPLAYQARDQPEPVPVAKQPDGYFQYVNVPAIKEYEFGWNRGTPNHFISRYEQSKDHRFRTRVRWGDANEGYGEHYWEYNHGLPKADYAEPSEPVPDKYEPVPDPVPPPKIYVG